MCGVTSNVTLPVEKEKDTTTTTTTTTTEPKEGEEPEAKSDLDSDDDDEEYEEVEDVTEFGIILLPNGGRDKAAATLRRVEEIFDPTKTYGTPRAAVAGFVRHAMGALTEQGNISKAMFTLMNAMHQAPEETMNAGFEVQEEIAQKEEMGSKRGPVILEAETDTKEVLKALEGCACMSKYGSLSDDMAKSFTTAVVNHRMEPHLDKYTSLRQARTAIRKKKVKELLARWTKGKDGAEDGSDDGSD